MDHKDFNILLTSHRELIYRVVRSKAASDRDADDIMQEVLLKIYQNVDGFKGSASLKTWIYRISCNAAADYYRKPWWKFDWLPLFNQDQQRSPAAGPFEQVSQRQSRQKIDKILEDSPTVQAEVFRLRFFEHLSLQDIVEISDMKLSTAKTHLYRAVKKIRAELPAGGDKQ